MKTEAIRYIITSLSLTLTGTTGSGCLVNTILPSRNGGTILCTSRWTLASCSSSKSSSTSSFLTTPLVRRRFSSHFSLSCEEKGWKIPQIHYFSLSPLLAYHTSHTSSPHPSHPPLLTLHILPLLVHRTLHSSHFTHLLSPLPHPPLLTLFICL